MDEKKYIQLGDLEVYQLARELPRIGWEIYQEFDWQTKKIVGDQFITATDSVGANIAEGYGRYHYLDRIKFLYNARGSLLEAVHWVEVLTERRKVSEERAQVFQETANRTSLKLQNFISAAYRSKNNKYQ
ncbi:MAG: four helix bundle protein [bacterium]|nr:four helix bundle protein [bacterium]